MSFLFYKRPPKVPKQDGHLTDYKNRKGDRSKTSNNHIPPELSFENVICNKCSPPCSLQDFLDYLTYISHDAETLQFYLWMIDYFQRFRRIPKMERALSPRWTGRAPPIKEQDGLRLIATHDIDILSEDISDCDTWGGYEVSEFTDQYTQTLDDIKFSISPVKSAPRTLADQFIWHPAEAQPLRTEITRIINHYLAPGSPRQLNLSHNDRATVLRALEYTTHPSALSPIKRMLDSTLRQHSHPNFIRWSIRNSTTSYLLFLRLFSATLLIIGFLLALILLLSRASRYYRLFSLPFWYIGLLALLTSLRGLCPILHTLHDRQSHAWETRPRKHIPDDEEMLKSDFSTVMGQGGAISYESARPSWPVKMEVFGPANNYSGEAWVRGYQDRGWWRRLFEHRVRVQDEGLRGIQGGMVRQAGVWSGVGTCVLVVVFVACPEVGVI